VNLVNIGTVLQKMMTDSMGWFY